MNEFKVIEVMNEAMIEMLKEKNKNCEKNIKIKQYLKDEAFFFKNNKDKSYEVLEDIGVKQDKIDECYKKLTSLNMFYELLRKGKINQNDKNLVIKYETNNNKDIFKKSK